MIKTSPFLVLMIFLLGFFAPVTGKARGGSTDVGGGGFAIFCPTTSPDSEKVELLDLYERRFIPGLITANSSGNLEKDYVAAGERIFSYLGNLGVNQPNRSGLIENLHQFFRVVEFVDAKEDLPVAHDLGTLRPIPPGCRLEQVAFFDDSAVKVFILRNAWDRMDSLSQAALVHHEKWYRLLRGLGDRDSQLARLAVAHIYAVGGVSSLGEGIRPGAPWYGTLASRRSPLSSFFYVDRLNTEKEEKLRVQFIQLQGRILLTKTWSEIPFRSWNLVLGQSRSSPDFFGCVLDGANVEGVVEAPLRGGMTDGLSVRFTYKSGEPIVLALLKRGELLSEGAVAISGCGGIR